MATAPGAVLEAIYAAYGSGWDDVTGVDSRRKGLTEEAIYLEDCSCVSCLTNRK